MSELSPEERLKILEEENKILKKKNDDLKNLEEELTAKRIYELAYGRIMRLITFGGVLTVVIGFFGYKSLMNKADAVVSKLDSAAVTTMAKNAVNKDILPKLKSQMFAQADKQIKSISDSIKPMVANALKALLPYNLPEPNSDTTENNTENIKTLASLPVSVDLSKNMNPVRNEGNEGSVVGFALASALEFTIWKQKNKQLLISPRFIYNSIKQGKGDNGAVIKDGIKLLAGVGAIEESNWPYVEGQFSLAPPKSAEVAYHYKIKSYSRLGISVENFKNALASNFPIIVGITITEADMTKTVDKTGVFPRYNSRSQIIGGHAICIVGYDDATKRIKFRNCWGTDWGDKGYGYISYQDIKANVMDDAWVIKSVF